MRIGVEVGIAAVSPVVLHAEPLQQAEAAEGFVLRLRRKGDVQGRRLVAPRQFKHGGDEPCGHFFNIGGRIDQQARARRRREGYRTLEFRIVAPAGALKGIGPVPVEDVLAVGMALEIERGAAEQAAFRILEHEVLRQPTGLRGGRAALLQGTQKGMADERVVARAGVPFGSRHLGDAADHLDCQAVATVGHALACPFHFSCRSILSDDAYDAPGKGRRGGTLNDLRRNQSACRNQLYSKGEICDSKRSSSFSLQDL